MNIVGKTIKEVKKDPVAIVVLFTDNTALYIPHDFDVKAFEDYKIVPVDDIQSVEIMEMFDWLGEIQNLQSS